MSEKNSKPEINKTEDVTLRTIVRLMIPFIQIFALYVITYGHAGPGGGFQGGVILGASFILFAITFSKEEMEKRAPEKVMIFFRSFGVLIYASIGLLGIFFGGNFLQYGIVPIGSFHFTNEILIYGVEIGIGMTVFAVMISIFGDLYE